ncbi:MAG: hypothetical protein ACPG7F_03515 [Aggregatilineales bacterium]
MLPQIILILTVLALTSLFYLVWHHRVLAFLGLLIITLLYALLNLQFFVVIPVPPGCVGAFLLAIVLLLLMPRRQKRSRQ